MGALHGPLPAIW